MKGRVLFALLAASIAAGNGLGDVSRAPHRKRSSPELRPIPPRPVVKRPKAPKRVVRDLRDRDREHGILTRQRRDRYGVPQ